MLRLKFFLGVAWAPAGIFPAIFVVAQGVSLWPPAAASCAALQTFWEFLRAHSWYAVAGSEAGGMQVGAPRILCE